MQNTPPERAEADPLDRIGAADHVEGSRRQLGAIHLHLDDDPRVAIARKDVGQRRNAGTPQLIRGAIRDRAAQRRRPIQGPIVMHDDHAVAREVDVELEAVGAEREAVVERGDRILRRQRAPAAMREHEGPRRSEEGMAHLL